MSYQKIVQEFKMTIDTLPNFRPSFDDTFMAVAIILAQRSTCCRRKVGAVLVNSKHHVIGTGYNGVAANLPHCIDTPCKGASCESGVDLDACEAIHAEQNALLQCTDVQQIDKIYVTTPPCIPCTKLLLNTSCQEIVSINDYPHEHKARSLWEKSGRTWSKLDAQG